MLASATLLAAALTGGSTWTLAQHPKFGELPAGARLDAIKRSPNHAGDGFQNQIPTPVLPDDRGFVSELVGYLFAKKDRSVPPMPIPTSRP